MKNKIFVLLMLFTLHLNAQNMVSNEVLQSVLLIKYANEMGSSFIVSIDNTDYLITAKHLFPGLNSKTSIEIEIFKNIGWNKVGCTLLLHTNPNIDIAVLDLHTHNRTADLFDMSSGGFSLSQETFFLGFPFGFKMDDHNGAINQGFPIPFVKKGIVSSFMIDSTKMMQIFLDGHNNPGFSGGPVAILNDSGSAHRMKIIGVVSGYVSENKVIKTPIGDFQNSENSGIVICYGTNHIYEIIKLNKP